LNQALGGVTAALQNSSSLDSYWYWKLTGLKAEVYLRQRRIGDSLALLKLELPAELSGTDVDLWRKLTLGMGNAYNLNFPYSQSLLNEAKSLAEAKHNDLLGEVLLRQGTLAWLQDDFRTAEPLYRASLQAARQTGNLPLEAAALGSLGLVASNVEHYDESLEWNRLALDKALAIHSQGLASVISLNIGWSYRELGDYENALSLFEQTRSAAKQSGNVRLEVDALINSGNVYRDQHNFELAKKSFQEALEASRSVSDQNAMALCFENLARLGLATGDLNFAQQNEERLADFIKEHPEHSLELYSLLLRGNLEQARKRYAEAIPLFQRVIHDASSTAPQRWEGQALLAETYSLENRSADAEREYRQALQTIDRARSSLTAEELRLSFLSTPIEIYDSYIEFLLKQARPQEALQVAELSRAMTLEEGLAAETKHSAIPLSRRSRKFAPESVAKRLNSILLFYWLGEKHSYLWAITGSETNHFVLPKSAELTPLVRSYRQEIVEGHDVLSANSSVGEQLYSILVEPAQKLIPAGSRVILLPAESLYGMNFESLIVPGPRPHFWIEDAIVSTASSLTLLASSPPQSIAGKKNLLLVGNAESPNRDFPTLAQASTEMHKIEEHFSEAQETVLQGRGATASAYLKSEPGRFAYLHFVTHGTASHTRPLESAVILSKEGDSYKLYARDIVQHPLNAELVTISACNGAGTRAYAGEGLVGLSWAFLRAGAHNVIGALWEVSDASSTPQLMDAMYAGIGKGQDPATALRNAKFAILHANSASVFKKPFYWAPFQLYTGS
jgi:CHAT domain-containing protein